MNSASNDKSGYLSKIDGKAIARYAMLPGIIPRIRSLGVHFGHFAYLMALVFHSAKLIPLGHPTLSANNIGQFGVRQVVALAASNIRWSWKNTDQIAIFGAVVIGLVLTLVQAIIIMFMAVIEPATAHASSQSFFETPSEDVSTDVVLIFLEQVFGPNLEIFGAASQPLGTPVYEGLQKVLSIYSMATMVIAVIIVLYYILTVIGEAAKTGTPFGQRFNSLWAPIRLVVALGLLVPLGSGLNSAQYITLWTAKMGSGLGTQIWTQFAIEFTSAKDIVSKPASSSTTGLVSRIFLSEVCMASYNRLEQGNAKQVKILQDLNGSSAPIAFNQADAMIEKAKKANMQQAVISWSSAEAGKRANDFACGYISIELTDFDFFSDAGFEKSRDDSWWEWLWGGRDLTNKIGKVHKDIRAEYISQIGQIAQTVRPAAEAIAKYSVSINPDAGLGKQATLDAANIPSILETAASNAHSAINTKIKSSFEDITGSSFARSDAYDEIIKRGWGAAGLWYGNLAKINQKYMDAINASAPTLGTVLSAPVINNAGQDQNVGFFASIFGTSRNLSNSAKKELDTAALLAQREYGEFIKDSVPENDTLFSDARHDVSNESGANGIAGGLVWLLGGSDLYDLKNNPTLDPMARIAGAGHAMLHRSFLAFGAGSVLAVGSFGTGVAGRVVGMSPSGKVPEAVLKFISEITGALATLFFTFAGIAVVAGIFLAFVIPIMPFVYFSFAIIGWVLEIFEAVVAMPLWALAHLRIDGDGMPGQAAIGGYQLLLMILMRPALIVFGLIGGYVIFGAAMFFLSTLFNSATTITQQDIAGNSIGGFGVFVYTMIFAFLTYNVAVMCFKMIDDVPKGILRWLGAGVQTFGDSRGDPIQGSREVVIGAVATGSALKSGLSQSTGGLKQAPDNFKKRLEEAEDGKK